MSTLNFLSLGYIHSLLALQKELLNDEFHVDGDLLERLGNNYDLYRLHNTQKLNISMISDDIAKSLFRFTVSEIQRIARAMGLPAKIEFRELTDKKFSMKVEYTLAITLRRLAYSSRLVDLQLLFGIDQATVCTVFNSMIELLYNKYKDGIRYNKKHMSPLNLQVYGSAIHDAGCPYNFTVGFIDGTLCATCRSTRNQRVVYSGHKKTHGLKYQAIFTPDGITVSLAGPFAGREHDSRMLNESKILDDLSSDLSRVDTEGRVYCIYGDSAYAASNLIMKPFVETSTTSPARLSINKKMASVRICVEWEFGHIATLFAFLKFKQNQKILLNRVGMFYVVATLFKNLHVCLEDNNMPTPILEVYMDEINPQ